MTAAPVVLVHASNTDARIWAEHRRLMAPRFRVVAPTQRYFGTSPWADDGQRFSMATHAADLADFIRGSGLGSATLVGWSYGAAVCLLTATEHPDLVDRLVLYEPAIMSFVHAPEQAEAAEADRTEMTSSARARIRDGDTTGAVRLFMDGVNDRPGAFDSLSDRVQGIMLDNGRTLPLLFAVSPPATGCADLGRLRGYVSSSHGETRRVAFYRIAAECAADCIPGSTLEVVPDTPPPPRRRRGPVHVGRA